MNVGHWNVVFWDLFSFLFLDSFISCGWERQLTFLLPPRCGLGCIALVSAWAGCGIAPGRPCKELELSASRHVGHSLSHMCLIWLWTPGDIIGKECVPCFTSPDLDGFWKCDPFHIRRGSPWLLWYPLLRISFSVSQNWPQNSNLLELQQGANRTSSTRPYSSVIMVYTDPFP